MLERVQQITYHGFPKNLYAWSSIIDRVSFFLSPPAYYQHIV
jgi:hypothetical protein